MQTIFLNETYSGNKDCVATIGFFDGVHKGHEFLIRRVIADARRSGLAAAVVTFDCHPREVGRWQWSGNAVYAGGAYRKDWQDGH